MPFAFSPLTPLSPFTRSSASTPPIPFSAKFRYLKQAALPLLAAFMAFQAASVGAQNATSVTPETQVISTEAKAEANAQDPIFISNAQSRTLSEIINTLASKHYRLQPVDDQLSERYFTGLLNNLDPSRAFLLDSDVAEFERFRYKFDDFLKSGNIDLGYTIYNRFSERLSARLDSVIEHLKDPKATFDFTKKEFIPIDRDEDTPWLANMNEADDYWKKRIKSSVLSLVLSGKTQAEAKEVLLKRYTNQMRRFKQQDQHDVFETLVNTLTAIYDPHTTFYSPRTLENFNIQMSLSLEGIGAVLQSEDEFTKVVRLIPAGPADKQGQLKAADRILGVGQGKSGEMVDVVGWRLDEVVELIRGKKGTHVRLQVATASSMDKTRTITIKRNKVKLEEQSAKKASFDVDNGKGELFKMGVIDVPTFYHDFEAYRKGDPNYKSTTRDVAKLLIQLQQEGVDGIILDLRNNGGGSLQEATALTDLFIDAGPVVQIRETNQSISRHNRSRSRALYRGPLVVLINRLSASASEIFAGAIQDYNRGLIIGTQSFGKGTVQSLTPVFEGRLKITESKFYRVSGDSTQHRGVLPDIYMPQVVDPKEVGENTYDYALNWDRIHPARHDKYLDFSPILPELRKRHQGRVTKDPDLQFVTDQFEYSKEHRERKQLSLNEAVRKDEQKQREKDLLALENKRRAAKKLEPFANFEAWESDTEEEEDPAQVSTDIKPSEDPFLMESGYILADYISLKTDLKTADAQKPGKSNARGFLQKLFE